MNAKLKLYQKEANKIQLADASPYKIIQLLMNGVIDSLSRAKGAVGSSDYESKGKSLSKASAIITSLKASLDMEIGGEVSQNLFSLYDYMLEKLADASMEKDTQAIDEVVNLFREIKSAWDEIPEDVQLEAEQKRMGMAVGG